MALSAARVSGFFDREQVAAFLDELVCATQRSISLVQALEHDQRCAFEVAGENPPYRGVRGRARVAIEPDEGLAALAELLTRYVGGTDGAFAQRLLGRTTSEVVLRLDPVEVSSWDYSRRNGRVTV